MVIVYQDIITKAYYWSCPYCSHEIQFWEVLPPVYCPKCFETLPFNPMSLIDEPAARSEYFFQGEPYYLEVY